MIVTTGTRFNHYEVISLIGAGGMGEVYLAEDPRLGRQVAIKVLPAEFAKDSDRLSRFEQEARATSSLNHPNILTVYDIGDHEGAPYIVAELLEGEELSELIKHGPIAPRKAVVYARQIVEGLAAAHAKGVVHRDLKPENLFVMNDGRVKILDFGLAKLRQRQFGGIDKDAPTQKRITDPGVIMGTVGYMSPEQALGQETDHRSDIFAFGAILYEMLTGQRAFRGDSAIEVMNAILKEEPPEMGDSGMKIAPGLEKVVRRCLEKKPEDRFHSAHDLGFALEAVASSSSSGSNQPIVSSSPDTTKFAKRGGWRGYIAWTAAGLFALIAALALAMFWFRRAEPAAQAVRFTILPPEKTRFAEPSFALSPDGRQLAFSATDATGNTLLYLRPLNSFSAQSFPGTEGATLPFWSPDSRSIAFFSAGKLKRVEVSGGAPQTLCESSYGGGGAWNRAGDIIIAPTNGGALYRVPATGGVPTKLTTSEPSRYSHWVPQFLPDGEHFLYYAYGKQAGQSGVYVCSLSDKSSHQVLSSEYSAVYAAGYLLFVQNGALMGQSFDTRALKLVGEPFLVAEQVKTFRMVPQISGGESGTLAFQSGGALTQQLVWFDRSGKRLGTVGEPADYSNPSLSADDKRLAVGILDPKTSTRDIWLFDLARGAKSRFTFDPADDLNPVWSKDGSRIFFTSDRKGPRDFFQKKVNAAEDDELIFASPELKNVLDLSPDGRLLIYNTNATSNNVNSVGLWLLPLEGERNPRPFLKTQFNEDQAVISPDGRWVSYRSDESGRSEIYVATFPHLSGKWQVSVDGGMEPQWRRDGKELFFTNNNRKLMVAEVKTGAGAFEAEAPRLLFETQLFNQGRNRYIVTADGQRFLVITRLEDTPAPINVVLNWVAEIKQ
ncbi:MAG: serine/threonine-protein kinase [Chloracidobacterium sp.]|nr:serine/threonine-protein kinase [Chloracidobacterium sp.]